MRAPPPPLPKCEPVPLQKGLSGAGGEGRAWHLLDSLLRPGRAPAAVAEPVENVPGAFLAADVLSREECQDLIALAERVGFESGEALVEVPRSVRSNSVAVLVAHPAMALAVSERLAMLVPTTGHGGAARCSPDFVNRRWRCYRYLPGDSDTSTAEFFGPHYDGAQPRSDVVGGVLVDDVPERGVERLSQMSVLLYLNEGHDGGETVFYPTGDASASAPAVHVAPRAGAALCFWHGRHPLSPLHEGAPLRGAATAPKYVIRTDVLYQSEAPPVYSDTWGGSSYVRAMLHANEVWARESE